MAPIKAICVLSVVLGVAACGGEPPPPENFAALHYEYLNKLRLNVGAVQVQDHSVALGDNDVSNQAPTPLTQAAAQMAHDRLFAAGLLGQADFVIDQASIVRGPEGVLTGVLAIHLALYNAAGTQTGVAEARVTRQHVPGSDPENLRSVLYDMTKQIMDDMNVELEFQIRRSLRNFLVVNEPLPAPVVQAPLDGPGANPPPPPAAAQPYQAPAYQPPAYQPPQYQPPQYQAPQYAPPQYQPQYQAAPQYQPPPEQPPSAPQYQPPLEQPPSAPQYQPPPNIPGARVDPAPAPYDQEPPPPPPQMSPPPGYLQLPPGTPQ
jgi:hypothetical protein